MRLRSLVGLAAFSVFFAIGRADTRTPIRLGDQRRARIDGVLNALDRAFRDWDLTDQTPLRVLLFDEHGEWLLGGTSSEARRFLPTGESWRGRPVLWNHRALEVSDKYLPFAQIKASFVGTVGTATHDGKKYPVLILQEWDSLRRHHPQFRDERFESWLAVAVHEGFHARQMWHPRVRPRIERWAGSKAPVTMDDLAAFFDESAEFRAAVEREWATLRAALGVAWITREHAIEALRAWMRLYRAREAHFARQLDSRFPGREPWLMDGFEMFVEGGARYVEMSYLIDPGRIDRVLRREPTFGYFLRTRGHRPPELHGLGTRLSKRYFYGIGAFLCFLLDAAAPGWKARVWENERLLLGEVERVSAQRR